MRADEEQLKPTGRRRVVWFGIIALVGIAAASYASYMWYKHHQDRYLRLAETSMNIDDREGAIRALRDHIRENPGDFGAMLRLADLLSNVGEKESAIRICERVVDENRGMSQKKRKDIYDEARSNLSGLLLSVCADLETRINAAVKESRFDYAISLADSAIERAADDPYCLAPDEHYFKGDRLFDSRADRCHHAVARKAFIQWRSGDVHGSVATLDNRFLVGLCEDDEYNKKRGVYYTHLLFSMFLEDYAWEMFERGSWNQSSSAYVYALEMRLKNSDNQLDSECGRMLYNLAVAKYNLGNYAEALSIVRDLQRGLPEYSPNEVTGFKIDCERALHR